MCPSSTSSSEPTVRTPDPGAGADGLIEAPERFGGGRFLLFLVVFVFLGATVGTGAVDLLHPRKLPRLKGDEKTRDEEIRAAATLLDGSLARLIESDLRQKSRVRRKIHEPYAWFLYRTFGEAKQVIVGEDGWLFLHVRARPPLTNAISIAERSANQIAALDRLLHARGAKLVAAPVPRKAVVLEELLPRGVNPVREIEVELVKALRARGVPAADMLSAFAGTEPRLLFHFGDSHWTSDAEILAAEEVAEVGGFRVPPEERTTELRTLEDATLGLDLFRWIGAHLDGQTPELQEHRRDKYDVHRKDESGRKVQRKNPEELGRIALAGTSYSARRSLPVYLTHCSNERVWNAAKPGEGPMKPLRDFLASLDGAAWPEIIVLEFPVHLTLSTRGMRTVTGIFADWVPPRVATVLDEDAWRVFPVKKSRGRGWQRLAQLRPGRLGHSGDGSAAVRLTGKVTERVELQLEQDGLKLEYTWQPGRPEIVMPLMAQGSTSGPVNISVRGKQMERFKLRKAEVVCAMDEQPLAEGVLAAPVREAKARWSQDARFGDGVLVPEQGVLQLELPEKRIKGRYRVELFVAHDDGGDGGDGPVRSYAFRTLEKDAEVVIGLDGLAGQRLKAARLVGAGKPPAAGLVRATVHGPAGP